MRVTRRRRRSTSGESELTGGKVVERFPACFYSIDDRSRLGDRRLHLRPGPLGLPAGADRRRAHPGRVRASAPSPAAGSRRCCSTQGSSSPYAPLCAALGALLVGALIAVTLEGFALGCGRG